MMTGHMGSHDAFSNKGRCYVLCDEYSLGNQNINKAFHGNHVRPLLRDYPWQVLKHSQGGFSSLKLHTTVHLPYVQ